MSGVFEDELGVRFFSGSNEWLIILAPHKSGGEKNA
jgi:hypothetical protein